MEIAFIIIAILVALFLWAIIREPKVIQENLTSISDFTAETLHLGNSAGLAFDFTRHSFAYADVSCAKLFPASELIDFGYECSKHTDAEGVTHEKEHQLKIRLLNDDDPEIRVCFSSRSDAQRCENSMTKFSRNFSGSSIISVQNIEGSETKKMPRILNYDVFICHASEDKEHVAKPLYEAFSRQGIDAFLDCFQIDWGDSLVKEINNALAQSRFVIAILSKNSVDKAWPLQEIHSVLSQEIGGDTKLLPLMIEGDEEIVLGKLPLISPKLYKVFSNNPDKIANEVKALLNKNSMID